MRRIGWMTAAMVLAAAWAQAASSLRRPGGNQTVDFDGKSFTMGDRRVLIRSGGLHYFRVPPEEWRYRLVQTRLAGFNTVETPIPWSLHQPTKDAFHAQGQADVGRFLDLCHEVGLMAVVRVGPYVNAALSNGGLPAWLGEQPRLKVRSGDRAFLDAVGAYWQRLLPLLVKRQAPDGPIVLMQIEDHCSRTAGGYPARLVDDLARAGCRVPIVLSDLNPCKSFQMATIRDDAVYATTELMPTPPVQWGQSSRPFRRLDAIVGEGLARGVDAYNLPMWAAGTNLVTLPASSFPTRFEAPTCGITETGALSDVHADLKRIQLFADAFESVLTRSTAVASHPLLDKVHKPGVVTYGRTDGTSTILFLKRRYGEAAVPLTDEATGETLELKIGDTLLRHLVVDHPLTPEVTLALSIAQILTIQKLPGRTLIVAYAPAGSKVLLLFRTPKKPALIQGAQAMAWLPERKLLSIQWESKAKAAPLDFVFEAGERVQVVGITEEAVAEAWVLDGLGVLVGAPGVAQWTAGRAASLELLLPSQRGRYAMALYPAGPQRAAEANGLSDASYDPKAGCIRFTVALDAPRPTTELLRKWQMAELGDEAAAAFDDSAWKLSPRPVPLGEGRSGWYRCTFRSERAAAHKLVFADASDAVTVFLNGRYLGQSATKRVVDAPRPYSNPLTFDAPVHKGDNVLAVLVKNWGRYRNTTTFDKPLRDVTAWGLLDDVRLDGRLLSKWRYREGMSPEGRTLRWGEPKTGGCPVRWYRVDFPLRQYPYRRVGRLVVDGASHGTMWLNGHFLGLYQMRGSDSGYGLYIPPSWLRDRNTLILLEEGGRVPGESELRFDRTASLVPYAVRLK